MYEKIKKIGRGTYGNVWLVRRMSDQQLFAMKQVPHDLNQKDESI
jgi:serine/threonine protein kinase